MRKIVMGVCVASAMMLMAAGTVLATPFSNTVDFSGDGTWFGQSYESAWGASWLDSFDYTHVFDLGGDFTLDNAVLKIRHSGNVSGFLNAEAWNVSGESVLLGSLGTSSLFNGWREDSFDLSPVFANIESDWNLQVRIWDPTHIPDNIFFDRSEVCGNFTPVPEPGSMMLLGTGLLGLVGAGRKFGFKR